MTDKNLTWIDFSDEELLEMRVSDLHLRMAGSEVETCIEQIYRELEERKILFRPICYLADEWFVPEGDTVIGIPFYLAHPRLRELEMKMMMELEGGTRDNFMRLIRHEAGHAVYYAYRLNKNRWLRALFGHHRQKEDDSFRPKPYSRSYVQHLPNWYAQTEADEDFAETFAVWLTPNYDWKKQYQNWKALKKLEFVDKVMSDIAEKRPFVTTTDRPYSVSHMRYKLKTYYKRKREEYEEDYLFFYDSDLKRLFSNEETYRQNELARAFLKRYKRRLVDKVALWTGEKKFFIHSLLKRMIKRSDEMGLRLKKEETETGLEMTAYLTSVVTNHILTGHYKSII